MSEPKFKVGDKVLVRARVAKISLFENGDPIYRLETFQDHLPFFIPERFVETLPPAEDG